jgi:hypothetical protein
MLCKGCDIGERNQTNTHKQELPVCLSRGGLCGSKETAMLWTIVVILLILWLLGLVSSYTLGGFIHLLLVFAVIIIVINLIQGRRAL